MKSRIVTLLIVLSSILLATQGAVPRAVYGADISSNLAFPDDINQTAQIRVAREGDTIVYDMILTNKGDMEDTYDITVSGATGGWSAALNKSLATLIPAQSTGLRLTAVAPADLFGGLLSWALFTVAAHSRNDITCATHLHALAVLNTTHDPAVVKFIGSGQTARYPIRVTNTGDAADNLTVESVYVHDEVEQTVHSPDSPHSPTPWGWSLSNTNFPLAPGAGANLTVKVSVGTSAAENDYYLIQNITVKSLADPSKTDRLTLITFVSWRYGVRLDCEKPWKKVPGGDTARFFVNVTNTGTMRDSISLSRSDPPPGAGWTASLGALSVLLDADETKAVELDVTPPADALANHTVAITVTGVSNSNPAKTGSVETRTTAFPDYLMRFNTSEMTHYVDPGKSTIYDLEVKNLGGLSDIALLDIQGDPGIWGASLNVTTLPIGPKSVSFAGLNVSAPVLALSGDKLELRVGCRSGGDPEYSESVLTRTIVNRTYNLTAYFSPGVVRTDPDTGAQLQLVVHNRGNAVETVFVETGKLPGRWKMVFNETIFNVGPHSIRAVTCTVTPDFTAPPENFSVSAVVKTDWTREEPDAIVGVNRVFRFAMTCNQTELSVLPGGRTAFNITVENRGNAADSVSLALFPTEMAPAWNWSLEYGKVFLSLGASVSFSVWADVPPGMTEGRLHECRVRGTSEGNNSFWREIPLVAKVGLVRALNVTGTPPSKEALPGRLATFSIIVKNTGNTGELATVNVETRFPGWNLSVRDGANQPLGVLNISPLELISAVFLAGPPDGAQMGNYTFNISVTTVSGLKFLLNFTVVVPQYRSFELLLEKDYVVLPAGTSLNVRLTVRNLGNGPEGVALNVSGAMGERWAIFISSWVEMGAGASGNTLLSLKAAADLHTGMHVFDIRGRGRDGTEKNVTLRVMVVEKAGSTKIDSPCYMLAFLILVAGALVGLMAYRARRKAMEAEPPADIWRIRKVRPTPSGARRTPSGPRQGASGGRPSGPRRESGGRPPS